MEYKKFIALFILIFYLLINAVSADELPNGVRLKDENIQWSSKTFIITPFNDTVQYELIFHMHTTPNFEPVPLNGFVVDQTMPIYNTEFYIDTEKENFDEFFISENEKGRYLLKQKKNITINKSTDIRLKYDTKVNPVIFSFDKNTKTLKLQENFNLSPDNLFKQYTFRVPTANAYNIKLNFQNSFLKSQNNGLNNTPVSGIYATDKYVEVSYVFWNENLSHQVVLDYEKTPLELSPNTDYLFTNTFSIEYDTVRYDWLVTIALSSIIAIFTFIGGALWGKRKKD